MDDAVKLRWLSRLFFSGPLGRMSARAMEKRNSEAEREAVTTLDPCRCDAVLTIGFGPGVGIAELATRLTDGSVGGIDPSAYMVKRATKRVSAAIADGRVRLEQAYAERIPWPDASFDGAIAVNSVQFWNPLATNIAEVARVLRPGARLVTVTHDWALARAGLGSTTDWLTAAKRALADTGFSEIDSWTGEAEDGHVVVLCASRQA